MYHDWSSNQWYNFGGVFLLTKNYLQSKLNIRLYSRYTLNEIFFVAIYTFVCKQRNCGCEKIL